MRPDDPLAERETVSAKDLENKSLILPGRTNVKNELSHWFGDSFQEKQNAVEIKKANINVQLVTDMAILDLIRNQYSYLGLYYLGNHSIRKG